MVRFGLGPKTGEIYELLARAGETGVDVARLVERRFREWPSGPSQEEVKALEHEGDRVISELLGLANTAFVTPFDRDDLVVLAFAVDDVARAARASLFKDDRIDPTIVIRWKDIYEALEDAVDACETAAHRVGNILVKNA